jgi:hypothetical protein
LIRPGFIYALVFDRKLILQGDCGGQCSEKQGILSLKKWLSTSAAKAVELQNKELEHTEINFDDTEGSNERHGDNSLLFSTDNEEVSFRWDHTHYNLSDWETRIDSQQSPEAFKRLEDLFAQGIDVLYGLLFHQVFSFQESMETPWQNPLTMSFVLELAEDVSPSSIEMVEQCMDSMSPESNGETECHIFVISTTRFLNETKFEPFLEERDGSRLWIQKKRRCTISFHQSSPNKDGVDTQRWKNIDLVARARSGWIAPRAPSSEPNRNTTVTANSRLIRERLEYNRHAETWKQGREPFLISKLPNCHSKPKKRVRNKNSASKICWKLLTKTSNRRARTTKPEPRWKALRTSLIRHRPKWTMSNMS